MTWRHVSGTLVFVGILVFAFWLTGLPLSSTHPVQYTCASGDTLTATALDTNRLRLSLSDDESITLWRRESAVGALYGATDTSLTFWKKGASSVLYQGRAPLYHDCSTTENISADPGRLADTTWYRRPADATGWAFALQHPRGITVKQSAPQRTRFLHAGSTNAPPALTDGFTVTVQTRSIPDTTTLASFVESEIASNARVGGSVLTPPTDTTHQGRPAIRWAQESAMGPTVTHWAIALSDRAVAIVSTSTVGPDTTSYEAHIRSMRTSLRFWQTSSTSTSPTTVPLALLRDPDGAPERGCDDIVFVDVPVARTDSPLVTALDTLFSLDRDSLGRARHFLAQTNETLHFNRAVVSNDTAHVYLTGRLTGLRGVCDNPRARIQIEETTRRVAGVEHVMLYRNGEPTNLQPDGRGQNEDQYPRPSSP